MTAYSRSSPAKPIVFKVLKPLKHQDRRHFSFEDVKHAITELYLNDTGDQLRNVGEVDGEWQFVCGTSKGVKPCTQSAVVQLLRRWKERHDQFLANLLAARSSR